ncbi:hypothetical protein F0562_012435 [Nyssa sinensis]|uniref:Uncharacterized protein n=1 Tax=Nyssa sinensis TaxID=561372 RepID=A0A5J4ZWI5_9ASTE|nr:hypothetical protein F0562_012435 [Nyssa sinensis]
MDMVTEVCEIAFHNVLKTREMVMNMTYGIPETNERFPIGSDNDVLTMFKICDKYKEIDVLVEVDQYGFLLAKIGKNGSRFGSGSGMGTPIVGDLGKGKATTTTATTTTATATARSSGRGGSARVTVTSTSTGVATVTTTTIDRKCHMSGNEDDKDVKWDGDEDIKTIGDIDDGQILDYMFDDTCGLYFSDDEDI